MEENGKEREERKERELKDELENMWTEKRGWENALSDFGTVTKKLNGMLAVGRRL